MTSPTAEAAPYPPVPDKRLARQEARARRRALGHQGSVADAAAAIARIGTPLIDAMPAGAVAGYWPLSDELDPRPLMVGLGRALALPVTDAKPAPLCFRAWTPGQPLLPGPLGTHQPAPDQPLVQPSILLVPLLAFDRRRHRLGYGGGYYDRTLASLRAAGPVIAIGLAYAGQEIARVPTNGWDEPLDLVLTECGIV